MPDDTTQPPQTSNLEPVSYLDIGDLSKEHITWIEKQLGDRAATSKEPHGDQSDVFRVVTLKGNYFLKVAPALSKERDRLLWLKDKLPVPKVVAFSKIGENDLLLMTAVEGMNLAILSKSWLKEKVVEKLAEVLLTFHSTDTTGCPFGNKSGGNVLVHGDACLPNFIFQNDTFSGYIDLGDLRVDHQEVDLAAACWSLNYNLGPGYGAQFLKKYGISEANEEMVEKLVRQYKEMQKTWGLSN